MSNGKLRSVSLRLRLVVLIAVAGYLLNPWVDYTVAATGQSFQKTDREAVARLMAQTDRILTRENLYVVRKAMGASGFVVEADGDRHALGVSLNMAAKNRAVAIVRIGWKRADRVPFSARSGFLASLFEEDGCQYIIASRFQSAHCSLTLDRPEEGLEADLMRILSLLERAEAGEEDLLQRIRRRRILVETKISSSWQVALYDAAHGLEASGFYVDNFAADEATGHLIFSTAPDAGLFINVFVVTVDSGALFTVVFHPDTSFGGVEPGLARDALDAIKEDIGLVGCLDAFRADGFCKTLAADAALHDAGFDFPVTKFEGASSLAVIAGQLLPHYENALSSDRLRDASGIFRPALAPQAGPDPR